MTIIGDYYELGVTSNFSFLHGASHAEELVIEAERLGISGIAIADHNTLAGVVRAHMAAKEAGLAFAPGCRLIFKDSTPDIIVFPENLAAYKNLCELLTLGKRRAVKGECELEISDLLKYGQGLLMIIVPSYSLNEKSKGTLQNALRKLKEKFSDYLYLVMSRFFGPNDQRHLQKCAAIAKANKVKPVAFGNVLYHSADRRPLQDVITCIKEHESLQSIGTKLAPNAERHLRSPEEMERLFKGYEQALRQTALLFKRICFSLDELKYQYPDDPIFEELGDKPMPSQQALERLTEIGLKKRFPNGAPKKVLDTISHETRLIKKLNYAPYFLTVYDIVRFARSKGILCQGRGSAANSSICYCLGITEVDPNKVNLLFERFISEERNEPPDIDVDFEHERREEVIQYIYEKYGRERAGLAATVSTYRSRSAIREVGKVFGLSDDVISAISSTKWGSYSKEISSKDARRAGLDPEDKHLMQMLDIAQQIIGFPRHLSQHVGGFVITRDRLSSIIPIENAAMEDRTVVEWDKDDLESLGMLKIDVLALGMLTCIRKAFEFLDIHYDERLTLSSLHEEDVYTYDMICRADTVGVFQVESRAQMTMLPRLRPRNYYDLVIEVAIVRPGPIQGDMVHPYLRRRQGKEPVQFPSKELEEVLGKTLGVPLFQEQAMNIAIIAGGFTPGEADKLRRAMATFRRVGTISSFQDRMVKGMVANGYEKSFAEHCFKQIEGFGEYGFPESHAASFALLVYVSCWLKCHYPDVFCAAILNSQPMGFYAPAQLIRDAREHGVEVREVDINHSNFLSTLETDPKVEPISPQHREMKHIMKNRHAVRLGLNLVKGFGEEDAVLLTEKRGKGYDSVRDLWMRSGLTRRAIEKLADADCFRSIGLSRRDALWAVKALDPLSSAERLPLFAVADNRDLQKEPEIHLPPMPLGEQVIIDYQTLTFSLKAHPMAFLRNQLQQKNYIKNVNLQHLRSGRFVQVSGLVLVRQRPGSAKGVVFETIEDETGVANIIIWPKTLEKFRTLVLGSRCVGIHGKLQSQDGVIHVVAHYIEDLTPMMAEVSNMAEHMQTLANADEVRRPIEDIRQVKFPKSRAKRFKKIAKRAVSRQDEKRVVNAMPKGRNFH